VYFSEISVLSVFAIDKEEQMDCLFCKIANGEIPSNILYEDDLTVAFLDINPANPGHTLVIPKKHSRNIFDIEPEQAEAVMRTALKMANAIKSSLEPDGMNLFQCSEPAGFQEVFHFHLHIIPRFEDDLIVLPWRPQQADPDELKKIAEKIKASL